MIGDRSHSVRVEVGRRWRRSKPPRFLLSAFYFLLSAKPRRQSKSRQEAPPLTGSKWPVHGSFFVKKTLQPFAHRRSNALMQTGDLAKAARPRPTWARLMNQELNPSLGSNMHIVGKLSHLMN